MKRGRPPFPVVGRDYPGGASRGFGCTDPPGGSGSWIHLYTYPHALIMVALWVRDRIGAMTIRIDAAGRQWASWDDPSLEGPFADPDPVLKAKVQQHGFPGAITKRAPRPSPAGASTSPPPAADRTSSRPR